MIRVEPAASDTKHETHERYLVGFRKFRKFREFRDEMRVP
jgi:hypothetical protein